MILKTLLAILTIIIICSCSSKTNTLQERKLTGNIKQGQFINDYMSISILDNWAELQGNDETQFLIIQKVKNDFIPNIIFLALDKKQYKEMYGFQTVEQYMNGLTDNYKEKPNYKLISSMKQIVIDKHTFFVSEFLLSKDNKEFRQYHYTTDIDNYYLGIITTDNNKDIEPDIEKIIKSIKFK